MKEIKGRSQERLTEKYGYRSKLGAKHRSTSQNFRNQRFFKRKAKHEITHRGTSQWRILVCKVFLANGPYKA